MFSIFAAGLGVGFIVAAWASRSGGKCPDEVLWPMTAVVAVYLLILFVRGTI